MKTIVGHSGLPEMVLSITSAHKSNKIQALFADLTTWSKAWLHGYSQLNYFYLEHINTQA